MKNKTWNEFWGEFLQVSFHVGHPDLWPTRERKALWAQKHFQLPPHAKILDLGCGDGMVDIWLSRMNFDVTAVDRNARVLELAKLTDDTKKVNFLAADLTEIKFAESTFDAVLFLEASGLMNQTKEIELFSKIYSWLKPNGKFILDFPESVESHNVWSREFPTGLIRAESKYDEESRLQEIQFYFTPKGEDEFGLYDPYDLAKGDVTGIRRLIYDEKSLIRILKSIGFKVQKTDHYYEKNFLSLLATK